jgi:hypothetical protein
LGLERPNGHRTGDCGDNTVWVGFREPDIEDRADFTFPDNGSVYQDYSEIGTRGLRQFRTL